MHKVRLKELQNDLQKLKDEIREFAKQTEADQCAALCETSAEVMDGLDKAFSHYLEGSEDVWKE